MSDQPFDQTSFVDSVEFRDEVTAPLEVPLTPPASPTPPKRSLPKPLLLICGFIVVSLLLMSMALLLPRHTPLPVTSPKSSALPNTIGTTLPTELQKSIDTLNASITAADPQNNDLPFPPVNFQLHLVPPQPTISQ